MKYIHLINNKQISDIFLFSYDGHQLEAIVYCTRFKPVTSAD